MTGITKQYYRPMLESDLDAVVDIELTIYSHPWTRGNFVDSLQAGYHAWVMMREEEVIGYAVMMIVLDEVQLLNLSVAQPYQKQGLGSALLKQVLTQAKALDARYVFLEVRASNVSAIALYQKMGFGKVSVRKGYYPLAQGREDAIIMRLTF
ncbi:MAG: ribosomal protein S18-alanine N-acetyltransferase [Methylotenera sp.]|jgi:[ribosomal protein S18]-alanine N-acetyltransferase